MTIGQAIQRNHDREVLERRIQELEQTNDSLSRLTDKLTAELEEIRRGYYELILAVQNKYPGETRHQTALRIIMESECGTSQEGQVEAALRDSEKTQ